MAKSMKLVTGVVSLTVGIVFTVGVSGCDTHLDQRQTETPATATLKPGTNQIQL